MASHDQKQFTYIQSITPAMKAVNLQFIVLDVGQSKLTKDGHEVRNVRIADQSGCVDLALWNELAECISPGDICRLKNGYTAVRKGCLGVCVGKSGELTKVGEIMMIFSESPNMSEYNSAWIQYENRKRSPPPDSLNQPPSKSSRKGNGSSSNSGSGNESNS